MKISHIHASFSIQFDSQVVYWRIHGYRKDIDTEYPYIHEYSCGLKLGWFSLDFFLAFIKK